MRFLILIPALVALAACETPEQIAAKEAEQAELQKQCLDGNMGACTILQAQINDESRRRAAMAAALMNAGNSFNAGAANAMQTTNCRRTFNGGLNCTTF